MTASLSGTRPARRVRPAAEPPPNATGSALDSLRRVVRVLRLAEQETRLHAGLSAAQLFVLRQLTEDMGASLTELAARTLTDRTSVAAVVDRLQEEGLVTTARDPDDRRRVVARVTAAGRQRLKRAPAPPTEVLVSAIARLPVQSQRQLARSLRELVAELGVKEGPSPFLFEDNGPSRGSTRA